MKNKIEHLRGIATEKRDCVLLCDPKIYGTPATELNETGKLISEACEFYADFLSLDDHRISHRLTEAYSQTMRRPELRAERAQIWPELVDLFEADYKKQEEDETHAERITNYYLKVFASVWKHGRTSLMFLANLPNERIPGFLELNEFLREKLGVYLMIHVDGETLRVKRMQLIPAEEGKPFKE